MSSELQAVGAATGNAREENAVLAGGCISSTRLKLNVNFLSADNPEGCCKDTLAIQIILLYTLSASLKVIRFLSAANVHVTDVVYQ